PVPSSLCSHVPGKKVMLSTTNGTIAIRAAAQAKKTYAASLLNGAAVAEEIVNQYRGETGLMIISGYWKQFGQDDFVGTCYLINEVMKINDKKQLDLTDSAAGAALFYNAYIIDAEWALTEAKVGQMLVKAELQGDIELTSNKNT